MLQYLKLKKNKFLTLENMSDVKKYNDKDDNEGGFQVSKDGMSCFACRCRRNILHKDKKKITDETGKTIIEESIETSSIAFGRGTTPPVQPRSLTIEERIEELEHKIDQIKN